eukprot:CAMPEP_0115216686 /NCGR_PEP_ID=MMETSP0270-20121206/25467_1 /TAXON_ID=71861 /ORGANISM="Scrippsiella trochoidea, Strain CCMP3099" /LENGTH=275 /DNA_ID=CAMNT_0002630533 /DNA_START=65 /DNA_END=892 /DNA_ORIENTATION=+
MALTSQSVAGGAAGAAAAAAADHLAGRQQASKLEDLDYSDRSTEFESDGSDCEGAASEDDAVAGACPNFTAEETLLILDWDDTLFPTAWIEAQGLSLAEDSVPSEAQAEQLEEMAERASLTVQVAKSHGTVVIVTNAEHGWIELSCQKFMPTLVPVLEDIKILSARSQWECKGVAQPSAWKLLTFHGEIDLFFGGCGSGGDEGTRRNIVSVGDSLYEREALIRVTDRFPNSWAKALKLMEKPGAQEFLKEHEVLISCLGDIVNHEGNLDVSICSP